MAYISELQLSLDKLMFVEQAILQVRGVKHCYGERIALAGIDLQVSAGMIFGLLGPNGGGKTTLFRLLSTLLPLQTGEISLFGLNQRTEASQIRSFLGITFQSPSLDRKLTVVENLRHQGHLYGLRGSDLTSRIERSLARFGVSDRARQRVETLSGGLQRRVEIAKGLLHNPRLLLLDEPSTGLDPGARQEMWSHLEKLRQETGVTILVTTHLMEEAEKCDSLAILDRGNLVAMGTPSELRSSIGGDCLTISTRNPDQLSIEIEKELGLHPQRVGETLRLEHAQGAELLVQIMNRFGEKIQSATIGKPTLEDVFLQRTGHRFHGEEA